MTTITGIILSIQKIIDLLVPLVFAVAFIVFIYGVFKYFILGGAVEEKRAEGRKLVMWGIVAFAIMVSVWGLVNLITSSFSFGSTTRPALPTFGTDPAASSASTLTPAPTSDAASAATPAPSNAAIQQVDPSASQAEPLIHQDPNNPNDVVPGIY